MAKKGSVSVLIVYTDRSPRRQRFRRADAMRQAQIVTASQRNHANVRGTILEDGEGNRHVFDRVGNYLFTVPANLLKRKVN